MTAARISTSERAPTAARARPTDGGSMTLTEQDSTLARARSGIALSLAAALAALAACSKERPVPAAVPEVAQALAAIVASCASASGDVQVRRAGQADWEPVAPGSGFRAG